MKWFALALSVAVVAALFLWAKHDVSTVGLPTRLALASTLLVPFVWAFVASAFGAAPTGYSMSAVLPTVTTFAGVMGASLALGGWALNWLWITGLWSLLAASLAFGLGRVVRARRPAR